ncbi:MAG: YidC/Oxa1 family membrane protein insertase [Treponema sp.]|nr:YidC/Oxa1 family membrane protein insertase [Treponema sp.]
MAEKQQQAEREKQEKMKRMKDNIKSAFKGDKQYMILSTLYRQHNYHPLYALRNSIDLFIQIPFFIAAYHFLSNLEMLNGQAFKFIKDLGAPDGLYKGINILPILMTLLNIVSGIIYTKGLPIKDKIQVYGIGAIFLVLLYNSPSALVLYWTSNNIYNLIKNILLKTKNAKKLVIGLAVFIGGNTTLYMLFFHGGSLKKRLFVIALIVIASLIPIWKRIISYLRNKIDIKGTALDLSGRTFALSLIGLFLLIGLVIPSSLIASDVEEFSFLEPYSSPLPYLGIVLMQSAGIALWLACIYFLFGKKVRVMLTVVLTAVLGIFLLNTFLFTAEYGTMTPDLHFEEFKSLASNQLMINIFALQVVIIGIFVLLVWKKKMVIFSLQCIAVMGMICFGIINAVKIEKEYEVIYSNISLPTLEKAYTFSRTGKNVLLIVLDRAKYGYLPYVFKEKPELLGSFKGFTYYPNTISFGTVTIRGMPGIFGGYYYTPLEIQRRTDELFKSKYRESMQVLPRIMAEASFKVMVYDQPDINYLSYDEFKNIISGKTVGKYTETFREQYYDIKNKDYYNILSLNLIKFSFFKASTIILHKILYDGGDYLSLLDNKTNAKTYSNSTINNYSSLYYLSNITNITDEYENYSNMIVNKLTHDPAIFKIPNYEPANNIVNKSDTSFADDGFYHVYMAAFILLSRWFDFLKENGVYDNTRIIIVSDHGNPNRCKFPNNIILPNGRWLDNYAALLMVKDFDMDFDLKTDNSFMTNADVPHIVTADFVNDLRNPFTGEEMILEKNNGVLIPAQLSNSQIIKMIEETGQVVINGWMHVHDNIFNPANWSKITIDE